VHPNAKMDVAQPEKGDDKGDTAWSECGDLKASVSYSL
jgi:hypothetical protein